MFETLITPLSWSMQIVKAQLGQQKNELLRSEHFSEDICQLSMSGDIRWKDEVLSDDITDKMVVKQNVFGSFVEDDILRNMYSNLIITKEAHELLMQH